MAAARISVPIKLPVVVASAVSAASVLGSVAELDHSGDGRRLHEVQVDDRGAKAIAADGVNAATVSLLKRAAAARAARNCILCDGIAGMVNSVVKKSGRRIRRLWILENQKSELA
jgi:hypothetical protein